MARVGFPPSKSPEVGRSSVEAAKGRQEGFALEEPCLAVTSAQQCNPEWGIKTPQGSTGYFGSHGDSQISQLARVIRQGLYEGMGDLSPKLYLNTSTAIPSKIPALSPANTELLGVIHAEGVPLWFPPPTLTPTHLQPILPELTATPQP